MANVSKFITTKSIALKPLRIIEAQSNTLKQDTLAQKKEWTKLTSLKGRSYHLPLVHLIS